MKKILLIICCLSCLLSFTGCDNKNEIESDFDNNNSNDKNELKKFKIGEEIIVTTDKGKYSLKITNVKESKKRNEYSDVIADRVLVVDYEYENISLEEDLYIDSYDFKLYDSNNEVMETYPLSDLKYPSKISTGRKTSASGAFALNSDKNYVELEYYNNVYWDDRSTALVILEW